MLMKVYLTKVSHKHGTDVFCAATSEGREKQIADYCREWWDDLDWGDLIPEWPTPDAYVIKAYWDKIAEQQETCGGQDEDYEEFEYWIEVPLLDELADTTRRLVETLDCADDGGFAVDLLRQAKNLLERVKESQPKD